MRNRRFLLLASVLVALNTTLWLVPQGLALSQTVISTLFGKNMVRAQVLETNGQTWHVDRGIVQSDAPGLLTLKEADTALAPIVVSSSTRVTGVGKPVGIAGLKPGWRVLVTWPAPSGPATSVVIEKRGHNSSG